MKSTASSQLHVRIKQEELGDASLQGEPEIVAESLEQSIEPMRDPMLPPSEESFDRPKKRTRLIMDCVLLWTYADLQRQREKESAEDLRMMRTIKNPKIKKAIRDLGFKPCTIRSRLKDVGTELFDIKLDKMLIDTLVPRIFLSNTYGGSPQEICPKIAKRFLDVHGYDDWMYLVPDYHPDAPQVPGASGIYLEFFEGGEWKQGRTMRVFTRVQTAPSLWQYMGMYEVKLSTSLSTEEWAEQRSLVRKTWASRIADSEWGNYVAARIRARRDFQHEPSRREIRNTISSYKVGEMVSAHQVEDAYLAGEEVKTPTALYEYLLIAFKFDQIMGLYTMKCVGYDIDFQRDLCEKFRNWNPRQANSRKRKKFVERE